MKGIGGAVRCRRYPGLDYSSKTSGFWAQKFVKLVTFGPLGTPKWYCWDLNLRTWIPVPQDMSLVIIEIRWRMADCAMSEFQMLHFTNLKFHSFPSNFGMLVPATFESLSDMNSTSFELRISDGEAMQGVFGVSWRMVREPRANWEKWVFPEMVVPPNHPF